MKQLHTEIRIAAPVSDVWQVLTDLPRYEDWNPFIVEASGEVSTGARLTLRMQPPGGRAITLRPCVTAVEPARALEWLGHLGVAGLFDGRHRFELHPDAGGTRLVQSEQFTGLLVPVLWRRLEASTRAGFEAFNEALRSRVLDRAVAAPS